MIPAETMMMMATIGLSQEQARAVSQMLKAVEIATQAESSQAIEARRSNDRERKHRQRHGTSREVTGQDVNGWDKKEAPQTPKEKTTPSPSDPKGSSVDAPKGADNPIKILSQVLSIETATEVVAHRKAIKSPLTAGSAKGLAKAFFDFGDADMAAKAMMANGWRGFRTEWMQQQPRAGPRGVDGMKEFARRLDETTNGPEPRYIQPEEPQARASDAGPVSLFDQSHERGGSDAGRRSGGFSSVGTYGALARRVAGAA